MVLSILSTALLATQSPHFVTPQAIDASLFKNGYAMVTYKIDVPASGELYIKEPPQGNLGTLWLYAEKGGLISEIVMTKVKEESTQVVDAANMVQILNLNKNKPADITVIRDGKETTYENIQIVHANEQIVVIQNGGQRATFNTNRVVAFSLPDAIYSTRQTTSQDIPALRIKAQNSKSVYLFALQHGLSWSPAYNIDISDEKELTLTAKSTVINDLVDLNVPEARFISGFPNIAFLGQPDPLTFYQATTALVNQNANALANRAVMSQSMDASRSYRPDMTNEQLADSFNLGDLGGFQAEDLYFYRQPDVNLKKGDRGYYVMFQSKAPYEHVYTLDIPVGSTSNPRQAPIPIARTNAWHKIKYKNTSGRPLTTAPALVTQNGQMLAQSTLNYTPPNAEVLLSVTQALDIASLLEEEETQRQRATTTDREGRPVSDTITVTGKLLITNFKSKKVNMVITRDLIGEITQTSHNGQTSKSASSQNALNPTSQIKWEFPLEPGEKRDVTYTFTMVIPTRG